MPQDKDLAVILKRMWSILEGKDQHPEDRAFFNNNLAVIQKYYKDNFEMWSKVLPYGRERDLKKNAPQLT
jgi:hypothetical protein